MKSILLLALITGLTGAARAGDLFTQRLHTAPEVSMMLRAAGLRTVPAYAGTHYRQFARAELVTFHALTSYHLSKRFGRGWDVRMNCFGISWNFVNEANIAHAGQLFHAFPVAKNARERAGVFIVAFMRAGEGHAVVLIITDAGLVWWDPQSGEDRAPTPEELQTAWYPQG